MGHFDKEGQKLSWMRRVMRVVEHFACMRGVWKPKNAKEYWNGKTVTTLWNGVWNDLKPYLLTVTYPTKTAVQILRTKADAER